MLMSQEGKDFAILLKIFFNYIQTLSLLGSVALDWSPNISAFFDFS